MKYALSSLFLTLTVYFSWVVVEAIETGTFVPKSPKHPILLSESPVMFWGGMVLMALVAIACLYVVWVVWTHKPNKKDL